MSLYSFTSGTTPDTSLQGQRVAPLLNVGASGLEGTSYGTAIQSSQGHNINKQVHFCYDVTQGEDTKTPFYDMAPTQGEFIFGRDRVKTLNAVPYAHQERSDPFVAILEARSVFGWNAWFSLPKNHFPTLVAAWEFGASLKFIGTLTAFEKASSMATICVSRNAFNVVNHWSPDLEPGMYAWFHLEVKQMPGTGRYMLRLQPYCTHERGPILVNLAGVLSVPVMTYKVGNALASDEIAYDAFDRVDRIERINELNGMPTKMLKKGKDKDSDDWVGRNSEEFTLQNYTNMVESRPRIPMFAVRGSIWGSTS